jgi:cytoskeletal protein CcmA (bactofilin family)
MFSRDTKETVQTDTRVPSIISASLRIVGDLVSEGDVQVDGVIEGDVRARSLTLSEGAEVTGQIVAETVRVRGTVHGQITADHVELGSSARVTGDVVHAVLSIEAGAFIDGHCRQKPEVPRVALPGPKAGGEESGETSAAVSL